MTYTNDIAMVGGTNESYENPNGFEEAWHHPDEEDREFRRTTIRKEFKDMIERQV